jgi:hypothetical protein
MKYYISGPISNKPDYMADFVAMEKFLILKDIEPITPIGIDSAFPDRTYDEKLKLCIELMMQANAVVVLDGWQKSKGANIEINLAVQLNMPVYEKVNDELVKMNIVGRKFDGEKIQWNLVPWDCMKEVAHIFTTGAMKYAPDNWKNVPNWEQRYFAAGMRHFTDWFLGERIDSESGKSHLAHAICCLLFLMWKEKHEPTTLLSSVPSAEEIRQIKKLLGV